jgi:LCP family protein required for cell wall assembly
MGRGAPSGRIRAWLGLIGGIFTVIVIAALAAAGIEMTRTITSVSTDPLRDVDIIRAPGQTPATGIAGKIARGERTTILLLGYGGAGHDGAYLTDSLMLASIEPSKGVVTLLSVPRDLWVTIPENPYAKSHQAKVNEAFLVAAARGDRDEALRIADATLEAVLGVTIDRTIAIDFRAFRAVVDAVGGIDVTVDRAFVASYPANDDPRIDPGWIVISFNAGPQHMDGETAIRYARARYSDGPEGNDFARAARQQKVMLAARDKIVSTNAVTRLFALVDALRDNVRTDLSLADMQALAAFAESYDDSRTIKSSLSTLNVLQSNVAAGTGYALHPRVREWSEVRAYVRLLFEHPVALNEQIPIVVRATAARAAAGRSATRRLVELGFEARYEMATEDPQTTIVSDSSRRGPESAAFLTGYFSGTLEPPTAETDFVVVRLGRDYRPSAELAFQTRAPTSAGP